MDLFSTSSLAFFIALVMNPTTLFDFNDDTNPRSWRVVDDVVMGGRSSGNFTMNEEGHGVFSGDVSTENNGGFSSVRCQINRTEVGNHTAVRIRLRGDGKSYQFRIKTNSSDYYSYITTFETSGEWEEIEIALVDLYPSFRGRKLNIPNFESSSFEEMTFLIANKRNEHFELWIDKIELI